MSNIGKQVSSIMATLDAQNFDLGYAKGWDAGIAYARNQIAQEIEALKGYEVEVGSGGSETFVVRWLAAAIARGNNE